MPQIIEVPGHGMVEFPDGMTDDQIVAAIKANTPAQQQSIPQDQSPQWAQSLANSAPVQGILGAGDATQNMLANIANLVPGVHAPLAKSGEGLAYDIGNIGGNIANYALPMGATTKALMAAKSLPGIGALAEGLLGSSIPGAIGKNALASAGYGALMNPESRGQSAAIEGALGGAGGALGSALSKLAPSNLFKTNISPEKLAENLDVARGTNTGLGDVIESPFLKRQYENTLPKILGSNVENTMHDTASQITNRGNELLNQMLVGNSPIGVKQAIQDALKDAYHQAQSLKNSYYDSVSQMADEAGIKIGRENFSKTASNILDEINKSSELSRKIPNNFIEDLKFYSNPENANSLSLTNIFRGILGEEASKAYQDNDTFLAHRFEKLKKGLTRDIEDSIPKNENNPIRQEYDQAQNFYRENIAPFEDPAIAKFTREGGDPDLILSSFVKKGNLDRGNLLSKLIQKLPESQQGLVPYGFFSQAIKNGKVNPLTMRSLYEDLGPTQKQALFSQPELAKSMADYSKLVGMNTEALTQMVNPKTGQRNLDVIPALLASHGLGAYGGYKAEGIPGAIAGGILGLGGAAMLSKAITKRLTSESAREKFVQKMLQNKGSTGKNGDLTAALAAAIGQQFQ
jgi:hypothetical protein